MPRNYLLKRHKCLIQEKVNFHGLYITFSLAFRLILTEKMFLNENGGNRQIQTATQNQERRCQKLIDKSNRFYTANAY